jgi:glycerol-3-phosphate acyltransferase PlsY
MEFIIIVLIAYLLGSIPTAVWVGKTFFRIDVREYGSKNAGATNTFRVLGKKPGTVVLIVDVIKGFVAVSLPYWMYGNELLESEIVNLKIVASLSVVIGHVFPVFAGFRGGKGVATSLGVIFAIHPFAASVCLLIFMLVFLTSNFVSLGAIISATSFPIVLILVFCITSVNLKIFSIVIAVAVIATHKKNIIRLLNGNENKMYVFSKKK